VLKALRRGRSGPRRSYARDGSQGRRKTRLRPTNVHFSMNHHRIFLFSLKQSTAKMHFKFGHGFSPKNTKRFYNARSLSWFSCLNILQAMTSTFLCNWTRNEHFAYLKQAAKSNFAVFRGRCFNEFLVLFFSVFKTTKFLVWSSPKRS
jgi:hypothetical protein